MSARLGYFSVCSFMLFSGGVTGLGAEHPGHQLGMQAAASAEALLLECEVFRAKLAGEGVMQQRGAEKLLAVLEVEAECQDVGVPVGVAVAAGDDVFVRAVAHELQEAAIFELDGVQLFQGPGLFHGDEVADGLEVEGGDIRVEGVAIGRIAPWLTGCGWKPNGSPRLAHLDAGPYRGNIAAGTVDSWNGLIAIIES